MVQDRTRWKPVQWSAEVRRRVVPTVSTIGATFFPKSYNARGARTGRLVARLQSGAVLRFLRMLGRNGTRVRDGDLVGAQTTANVVFNKSYTNVVCILVRKNYFANCTH